MTMKINKCRSCGCEKLKPIISLGNHYVSGFVDDEKNQGEKVPLSLVLCRNCKLLQMEYSAPPESMWNDQYWYKSGINSIIKKDLRDIAEHAQCLIELESGDFVIDIGNNDGTMFEYYNKDKDINLVGFEPCKNVAEESRAKGFNIINNFFNADDFQQGNADKKAKIITAISMFYDVENPNEFLEDITKCLDENGIFIIQQNYLVSMLEQVAFDNICHEHREYYSLKTLNALIERHGLEIFDVELNDINGGSIRTYIKFKGNKNFAINGAKMDKIIEKENVMKLDTLEPYLKFAEKIEDCKLDIMNFLDEAKENNKTVGLCGASTRGNTILQYFNITPNLVIGASEANPDKHGKKTIGTLIPIMSIDEMKALKPDYQLVIIWHLFEGIQGKEKDFLKEGGKFVLPLPKFRIVKDENI